ncbi:OpgC family protein [uncultured Methylobacterium sp.]|uniref:OpgC family protein n=1 Tax=uncultured Methylobacterium sp. TaxID=157278 RepID=UPI0035CC6A15
MDVLRGFALLTIFVDHIPDNALARFTLHNFGFSDAAELFVLLAGYSSMIAYGGLFQRAGTWTTLRRIGLRCVRIYAVQAGLLLATLVIVRAWMDLTGLVPRFGVAPLMQMGIWQGLLQGLILNALPNYLDILPLYIILLILFPAVYGAMQRSISSTLLLSASVWLLANHDYHLNLPNVAAADDSGWYFNPFAWQFLFTIGAALALAVRARQGFLPQRAWLVGLCWAYLGFAFLQAAPWSSWGLPDLSPAAMPQPDKGHVAPLRLINILALIYLLFSSAAVHGFALHRWVRPLEVCGRHSLEIFAAGCLAALAGRILYRTFGATWMLQVATNATGLLAMIGLAFVLDLRSRTRRG